MTTPEFIAALKLLPAFSHQPFYAATEEQVSALVEELVRSLDDENEDLHLVAQGIKHYWGCVQNAACTGWQTDECVRCRAERVERLLKLADDALSALSGLHLDRSHPFWPALQACLAARAGDGAGEPQAKNEGGE